MGIVELSSEMIFWWEINLKIIARRKYVETDAAR